MSEFEIATGTMPLRIAYIRTSDRLAFKQCRRLWNWSYVHRGNRTPQEPGNPLWLGSGFHFALENIHGPRWFPTGREAFMAYCEAWQKATVASKGRLRIPQDWRELTDLACGMVDYYEHYWLRNRDPLRTFVWNGRLQTEVRFEIEIPLDPGLLESYGYDKAVYQGTIDRVAEDEYGRLWICVSKDTWVWGPSGICKIQDHPQAVFKGRKETVTVKTDRGYSVTCTPDHRILTARGWVEARNLVAGDQLVIAAHPGLEVADPDDDFWWMVGYWLGDGSLRNPARGSIDFATGIDFDFLGGRLKRVFEARGEIPRYAKSSKSYGYWYVTNQAKVADFIRDLFNIPFVSNGGYKKNLYLPLDRIKNLPAFLQGLFDADGTISEADEAGQHAVLSFSTRSEQLAKDVQIALAAFGVTASIRQQSNELGVWYTVVVSDAGSMKAFKSRINFSIPRKAYRMHDAIDRRGTRAAKIQVTVVVPGPEVEVFDILDQPNQIFYANGLAVHNCEYKTAKAFMTSHFDVDPQITAYCWAGQLIYGRPIAGVVYQQHKKQIAQPPEFLKTTRMFSVNKKQVTTHALYRDALLKLFGDPSRFPAPNVAFLNNLAIEENGNCDLLVRRDFPERNQYQIEAFERNVLLEAADMLNPNLAIYPNPTRDCSWKCSFHQACINMDDGGDWQQEMDLMTLDREEEKDLWRPHLQLPPPATLPEQEQQQDPFQLDHPKPEGLPLPQLEVRQIPH